MAILLLVVLALAVIVGVGVVVAARAVGRNNAASNELIPGVASTAPREWAGSHSPEARLHRRLRDAVAPLADLQTGAGSALGSSFHRLQQEALALDEQLIASSGLAEPHKTKVIAGVERSVVVIEDAVAAVVAGGTDRSGSIRDTTTEIGDRLDALAAARAEVDALDQLAAEVAEDAPEPRADGGSTTAL